MGPLSYCFPLQPKIATTIVTAVSWIAYKLQLKEENLLLNCVKGCSSCLFVFHFATATCKHIVFSPKFPLLISTNFWAAESLWFVSLLFSAGQGVHLGSLLQTIQLQTEMRLIILNPTRNGQFLNKTDPCIWLPTVISQHEQIHFQEKNISVAC